MVKPLRIMTERPLGGNLVHGTNQRKQNYLAYGFNFTVNRFIEPKISNYIHRIASGGYYGFDFVTPTPPQCVERFHRYHSNKKNIIASLLKFAGYIHSHKILSRNILGLILKNNMAAPPSRSNEDSQT